MAAKEVYKQKPFEAGEIIDMVINHKTNAFPHIQKQVEGGRTLNEGAQRQVEIHFGPDKLKELCPPE